MAGNKIALTECKNGGDHQQILIDILSRKRPVHSDGVKCSRCELTVVVNWDKASKAVVELVDNRDFLRATVL